MHEERGEHMKYYVVADIHGYYTYFKDALDNAGFFDEKEPCKLVVCGDLLDRGSETRESIELMLKLKSEGRLIYVLGNHEDLLVKCLQAIAAGGVYDIASGMSYHYRNKTWHTLLQISGMNESEACEAPNELVSRVMGSSFYSELLPFGVDYYETENHIFTHGWIPCITEGERPYVKYKYDSDWRNADIEEWQRARWYNGMDIACNHNVKELGKTIVCGHWRASYGHANVEHIGSERGEDADYSPFVCDGILAIDACATVSHKINCVVIEDSDADRF